MNEYPSIPVLIPKNITEMGQFIYGYLRQITRMRGDDVREISNLKNRLVMGRLRIDRVAPTSNSDIQTPDQLGDIVRTGTYEYIVVNDSGTLKWARHAIDVTW